MRRTTEDGIGACGVRTIDGFIGESVSSMGLQLLSLGVPIGFYFDIFGTRARLYALAHAARCARCQRYLDSLVRLVEHLAQVQDRSGESAALDRIQDRLYFQRESIRPKR